MKHLIGTTLVLATVSRVPSWVTFRMVGVMSAAQAGMAIDRHCHHRHLHGRNHVPA